MNTPDLTALDTYGRAAADASQGCAPGARNASGVPAYVGRLRHSPRRWSWAVRFDPVARELDDGSQWEPVAVAS